MNHIFYHSLTFTSFLLISLHFSLYFFLDEWVIRRDNDPILMNG